MNPTPARRGTANRSTPRGAAMEAEVGAAIELLLLNAGFEAAALIAQAGSRQRSGGEAESPNAPSARK